MKSIEIRKAFFDFFESKGHSIVPSAPMVVKNDPTLMFTNAGMNQFKDIFLGNSPAIASRVANTQKCLRVSGKHNDLEEVGHDTYHHTMFEMLGNWSFGDYFKKEAIAWAWELLVDVFEISPENLYATIFEGDEESGLERDSEAYEYWKAFLPEDRIINGSKKDNFWEMGDTGPCGPCSEIHIDLRSKKEKQQIPGRELVNKDHPHVIEIWNNVFIQYNRKSDGSLDQLPQKHVDTGMGFERLCMVIQGKQSNYDTDVFQSLIRKIEDISSLHYRADLEGQERRKQAEIINVAMRVIADHTRAIAFSIADGQLPSNTGAGYVIRRILRRAVRYGYQALNLKEPFIYRIVSVLAKQMGHTFPELVSQKTMIETVIKEEEASFYRTLSSGLKKIDDYCIHLSNKGNKDKLVDGKTIFELYDTFGFPIDLTALIAKGYGLEIDEKGFNNELDAQKNRSRNATQLSTHDWVELLKDDVQEFIGYDYIETDVKITKYRKVSVKNKDFFQLVFNYTPFYGESGGQVGDVGYIEANGKKTSIFDTKKENNLILHYSNELPVDVTTSFKAVVSTAKRNAIACNHTSTHLLHKALIDILGPHIEQQGSLVHHEYLRFDFSHFQKMTEEEIASVENLVNERIRQNIQLKEHRSIPIKEAEKMGATALFGEKYGDLVRVIHFGDSMELCGGTHVNATGQIGYFKITSEGAIAAGIRRIEAISSEKSQKYISSKLSEIKQIEQLFKTSKNIVETVENLLSENAKLNKQIEVLNREKLKQIKQELINTADKISEVTFIARQIEVDSAALMKDLSFQIKGQVDNLFMVLGAVIDGKPSLSVMISENLVTEKGLDASKIIKEIAKEIKGGGGGQSFYATAGGKNVNGIKKAIESAKFYLA